MVLYIHSESGPLKVEKCPPDVDDLIKSSSLLKNRSLDFIQQPIKTISPSDGLVYISQGEVAIGISKDPHVTYFGSEDATTCHILVLRHAATGSTALAHIDHTDTRQLDNLCNMIFSRAEKFKDSCQDDFLILSLVGGYEDERGISRQLSSNLLRYSFDSKIHFAIDILAVGELNTNFTKSYPSPILYGAAVELSSGQVFGAKFPDHGPDNILRHVRLSHSCDTSETSGLLHSVYNPETGQIVIPSFRVQQMSQGWKFLARVPDYVLLQRISTSPKVEPSHFVSEIRESIQMVIDHPNIETTIFKEGRSRIYERHKTTGEWTLLS